MSKRESIATFFIVYDDNPSHLMLVHIFDNSMEQTEGLATNSNFSVPIFIRKNIQQCHLVFSSIHLTISGIRAGHCRITKKQLLLFLFIHSVVGERAKKERKNKCSTVPLLSRTQHMKQQFMELVVSLDERKKWCDAL